jgi:ribose transport system substrate-binding protein
MAMNERNRERYLIKSLVHASQVLESFGQPGEALRLCDVVERTGFGKGMCFRLLHTLRHCGFIEKVDESRYRLAGEARRRKRHRIGYAAQGQDTSFPREVHESLRRAAEREDLDLVVVDNRYQPKVAVRNAEHLIREKVDVVIEFQTDEAVAPAIASRYFEADIPLIAIDVPHPGATYFGANNYHAGLLAGRHLAKWARTHWSGQVDEILLLELGRAGALVRGRMSRILAGIRELLPETESCRVHTLDGDGQFGVALERVRRYLRSVRARHILVGAANDPSALGAARAFQEAGRADTCAIVGQNAELDARAELREPRTPFVASVAYFPERYGDGLIRLALDILARRHVPPALFIRHQLVTPENVDHVYSNDGLLGLLGSGFPRPAVVGATRARPFPQRGAASTVGRSR